MWDPSGSAHGASAPVRSAQCFVAGRVAATWRRVAEGALIRADRGPAGGTVHMRRARSSVGKIYDFYKAEYIWVDGTEPVHKLRSKAKVVPLGQEPPIWAFD